MNKGDRADGKAAKKKYKPKALIPTEFSSTDQKRFQKLVKWMEKGGSTVHKIELRLKSKDNRGVYATANIQKGETLLFVPLS